ncbi:MAG TPA: radical SAM protein [Streptosporangiaceae bacterium]|nr:radical SAM protein [Streptosporangiaceae bacterium]
MAEHSETWDGGLTVSAGSDGTDSYDFGSRAAAVTSLKSGLRLPEMTPLPSPWTLEIEPTLLCNARCHFCSYEDFIRDFRERQRALPVIQRSRGLAWERVRYLLEEIRGCGTTRGIFWSGGGEPLVWPHLTDTIIASSEFADVSLQTNGIKLDRLLTGPRVLGNLSVLSISVYSDLREQHKQIAGVDSFERVSRNIQDAVAMRDRHGWSLTIGAKILVDRISYGRLPEIIRYYRTLGADSVALREVQGANHGEAGEEREIGLRENERHEVRRQASERDADPALLFFARALSGTHGAITPTRHCYNATDGHFACVDAEGEVYLGNPEIGDRQYSIGNILASSWHDIWRSGRHLEVIRLMDMLQRSAQCRLSVCRHVRANIGAEHALTLIKPALPLDSFL